MGSERTVVRLKDDSIGSAACDFMSRSKTGVTGLSGLRGRPWGKCGGVDMGLVVCDVRLVVALNSVSHISGVTVLLVALGCNT